MNWMRHYKIRLLIAFSFIAIDYLYGIMNYGNDKYPLHYFYLGAIDTVILFLLPHLFGKSPLVHDLQRLNYCAVIAHFYGFCIYMLYLPPISYNVAIYFLAGLQYLRLFWINKNDRHYGWNRDRDWSGDLRDAYINLPKLFNQREDK